MTSDGLMLADSMLADSMPEDEMRADDLGDEFPTADLLVDDEDADPVTERDFTRPESLVTQSAVAQAAVAQTAVAQAAFAQSEDTEASRVEPADDKHMDSRIVEELTNRLPTSELIKIIKNALECGRRNVPFTESDLLRTMTFGSTFAGSRQQGSRHAARQPGARTPGSSRS